MKKDKRFQIIKTLINSTSEITISAETDKSYSKVTKISMYSNPIETSNVNLEMTQPLFINNKQVFPNEFDTALLFPKKNNDEFREIEAETNGSLLEVRVTDANYTSNYYLTIILELENE